MGLDEVLRIPFGEVRIYPKIADGTHFTWEFRCANLEGWVYSSHQSATNRPTTHQEMLQDMLNCTRNEKLKRNDLI